MTNSDTETASAIIVSLLANRATDATLCPSEAARALATENTIKEWRIRMPIVHAAIDGLLHNGAVCLSWKGEPLKFRSGPYQIADSSGVQQER